MPSVKRLSASGMLVLAPIAGNSALRAAHPWNRSRIDLFQMAVNVQHEIELLVGFIKSLGEAGTGDAEGQYQVTFGEELVALRRGVD